MLLEDRTDDPTLDPLPPSVDDPYLLETGLVRLGEILLDHGWDVLGRERMEIDLPFNGQDDGVVERERERPGLLEEFLQRGAMKDVFLPVL